MPWISTNAYLTQSDMENNATEVWNYFGGIGWTLESVSAMLGNMQSESTINPGVWQSLRPWGDPDKHGFGLVQWTPYTNITDWMASHGYSIGDGNGQCRKIHEEMLSGEQWIATSAYPFSFEEFSKSTDSPYTLALAFLANYERPADPNQPQRGTQAEAWYSFLSGKPPKPPTGAVRKLPLWMMLRPF